MDDTALVARASGGDEEAFELLVRRHVDAAWRHARTMLADDFAAEEAVQDAFLKAYRSLSGFRAESSFRTWLLAICHRACIDRLRLFRPEMVELHDRPARLPDPDLRISLAAALPSLGAEERDAFCLVDVLGYSREDAARIAGVPSSTMRSRVSRARERLAGMLSEAQTTDGR